MADFYRLRSIKGSRTTKYAFVSLAGKSETRGSFVGREYSFSSRCNRQVMTRVIKFK